ncbi:nucleoside deaminase [Intrasporangium calvum]|uniref:Nucleoside deaminase n=1 Tax=Intrasporangium calvum TaxID=53358 RepID=A0ABT5GE67_9MICO|nr:nucleoside deaminase [Intrasporangium calvum]MDC5696552.1 nucleoside deaminase [Intrasporangium calvum]
MNDEHFLQLALEQARSGLAEGGIPIGAVLVADDGTVLGAGRNRRLQDGSAIRHGETDALEAAGRLRASVYARSTMYTTLSPCHMCTGAVLLYKIPRLVLGENRNFLGAEDLLRDHGVEVVNLDSEECAAMMRAFIDQNPAVWNEDIGELDARSS